MIRDFIFFAGLALGVVAYIFALAILIHACPLAGIAAFIVSFGIFGALASRGFI